MRDWFFIENGKMYEVIDDDGVQTLESEESIKGKRPGDTRVIHGNLYYIHRLYKSMKVLAIPETIVWKSYDPEFYIYHHDNME